MRVETKVHEGWDLRPACLADFDSGGGSQDPTGSEGPMMAFISYFVRRYPNHPPSFEEDKGDAEWFARTIGDALRSLQGKPLKVYRREDMVRLLEGCAWIRAWAQGEEERKLDDEGVHLLRFCTGLGPAQRAAMRRRILVRQAASSLSVRSR